MTFIQPTPCSLDANQTMRDAIAHPALDFAAAAFVRELAARLDLRCVELPLAAASLDAALAVAPVGLALYRATRIPVVVLTPVAAASPPVRGSSVVCGVQDEADAACVAIAGALAEGLGLPVVLVHVEPMDDRGDGGETVATVARAAGLDHAAGVPVRFLRGAPGRTIAATARLEGATLVVVSESVRRLPKRAIFGPQPDSRASLRAPSRSLPPRPGRRHAAASGARARPERPGMALVSRA